MKLKQLLKENNIISLQPLTEYDDGRMRDFEDDHNSTPAYDSDGDLTEAGEEILANAMDSFHDVVGNWIAGVKKEIADNIDNVNDDHKTLYEQFIQESKAQFGLDDILDHHRSWNG